MPPLQTPRAGAAGRDLRRASALSVGLVLVLCGGAALAAGAASWASRPEAWSLGPALPLEGSVVWIGLAGPVLAPVAGAVGFYLAARACRRSGEVEAWTLLGFGPRSQWWAAAPIWGALAVLTGAWSLWGEPSAWLRSVELRELAGPTALSAVALDDGGVMVFQEETVRLRSGGVEASVFGVHRSSEAVVAGPLRVKAPEGTWTARGGTFVPRAEPRRRPLLAASVRGLRARAGADDATGRRAASLLHRRVSSPLVPAALSWLGWFLGVVGKRRVSSLRAPLLLGGAVLGVLLVGRLADAWTPLAGAPPALLGWAPAVIASALAAAAWVRT